MHQMRDAELYMDEGFAAEHEGDWPAAAAAFERAVCLHLL
jgi:hypothetical protein